MISPAECARLAQRAYAEATWRTPGDVEALLIDDTGYRATAVRGSETDFRDWLRNFRVAPWRDWQLGFVHKGYLEGARALWPLVRAKMVEDPDPRPRLIVGHSAGGSIGTVLAGMMAAAGRAPALLCTFGAPRPGFGKLGATLREARVAMWRYVHGIDCVPDHPWPVWGYRHPCDEIRVRDALTAGDRIKDHAVANYVRVLSAESAGIGA
jgi:hypothetical protein